MLPVYPIAHLGGGDIIGERAVFLGDKDILKITASYSQFLPDSEHEEFRCKNALLLPLSLFHHI
jgi:hypothetical protein